MEPAGYRREHLLTTVFDFYPPAVAAMEPAGYRREHSCAARAAARIGVPQWSPPVIGGSTASS